MSYAGGLPKPVHVSRRVDGMVLHLYGDPELFEKWVYKGLEEALWKNLASTHMWAVGPTNHLKQARSDPAEWIYSVWVYAEFY